jgi:hypothetical protein
LFHESLNDRGLKKEVLDFMHRKHMDAGLSLECLDLLL